MSEQQPPASRHDQTGATRPSRRQRKRSADEDIERWREEDTLREQAVKEAVARNNKGWYILVAIGLGLLVLWALNLRTCQDVDWQDYFINPDDARALGAQLEYPNSAQVCTYAISGDKVLILSYPTADSVDVHLKK